MDTITIVPVHYPASDAQTHDEPIMGTVKDEETGEEVEQVVGYDTVEDVPALPERDSFWWTVILDDNGITSTRSGAADTEDDARSAAEAAIDEYRAEPAPELVAVGEAKTFQRNEAGAFELVEADAAE